MMVSELEFKRYVAVQYSGLYNMIMDAGSAMKMMETDKDTYFKIISNYDELVKKYPKAFEEGQELGRTLCRNIYK